MNSPRKNIYMKLKNGQIFNAQEPLGKLMGLSLPVITSLKVAKLADKVQTAYRIIDEVRLGLVRKYGSENESGRMRVLENSPEWEGFLAEYVELMEQEIELVFDVIDLPPDLDIEPSILMGLLPFVEVKGVEGEK